MSDQLGPRGQVEEVYGNVTIRRFPNGAIDEILIKDRDGKFFFHLEQMDDNGFWMRFDRTDCVPLPEDLVVDFHSRRQEPSPDTDGRPLPDTEIRVTCEFDGPDPEVRP